MPFKKALIVCAAMLISPLVFAQTEADSILPYRPSVSSPAQLPVAGQLEFELGALHLQQRDKQQDNLRDSLPFQFKLAFNTEWGVLIGGEAAVASKSEGITDRGAGDINLVLKRAFKIDEKTVFGLELGSKIATAKRSIGSGANDWDVNSIYSRDVGSLHIDANFNLTHLGAVEAGSGNLQKGLSASFSYPIADKWGLTAELSGTQRQASPSTAQSLMALTYSPSNRLTLDMGFVRGLNKASPDWSFFSGFVVPLAKLF